MHGRPACGPGRAPHLPGRRSVTELVWLRRDLRSHDHPTLNEAAAGAQRLVPVFCFDERLLAGRHASGPRTQFMLESLAELDAWLRSRGSRLVVRHGRPEREIVALARQLGAVRVHFTADVGPFARRRDERLARELRLAGIEPRSHPGTFIADQLGAIRTVEGAPYSVFSSFYRRWRELPRRAVQEPPAELPPLPARLRLGQLPSLTQLGLRERLEQPMPGGERAARARMDRFLAEALPAYGDGRDELAREATSRLSPYLHFGCISPLELELRSRARGGAGAEQLCRQLCWREFFAYVLLHHPENASREHQHVYRGRLRYSRARTLFEAWCAGQTGYPLVDAGMRQLRREGWMHNRARLVVGSFLTKDLGIDWRWGERWFMRLLLDGDQASNNGNWQWIASVGADPAPLAKRILNPARQQERFDPDGTYVRRHVPELRPVPDRYLAEPWRMPLRLQRQVGCVIGRDYPAPIVDHLQARRLTLARYAAARSNA